MTVTDRAISVGLDYDPNGRVLTGSRVVAEAAIRRLDQSPGTLFYSDDDYGQSVVEFIGRNLSATQIASLIESELTKDERIIAVQTEVTQIDESMTLEVNAVLDDGGDFDLTIEASSLGIQSALVTGVS